MRKFIFIFLGFFFLLPCESFAQWRIGVTGGIDYNMYTSDKHYLTDFYNEGEWGMTLGVAGQCELKEWDWLHSKMGLRVEANITEKSHVEKKAGLGNNSDLSIAKVSSYYFQIPFMVNYSLGCETIRTFVNAGAFGGFINGRDKFHDVDVGGVGGIGAEYNYCQLTFQAEARAYVGTISDTKSDRIFKTPHYYTTLVFQLSLFYNF